MSQDDAKHEKLLQFSNIYSLLST